MATDPTPAPPAYTDPPGFHRHKCHFCGYVWDHHDANDVRHGAGGAHECPNCGRCNWSLGIYSGPAPPSTRNGLVPPGYAPAVIHPDQRNARSKDGR